MTRCERLPHMKEVRDFLREHLNETAERLNQASDGALKEALVGYVDEGKLKQLAKQNEQFREFWAKWKWLVRMQQWCPYVDEMDGAVERQADETPRHAYCIGRFTSSLVERVDEAERAARKKSKSEGEESERTWTPTLRSALRLVAAEMRKANQMVNNTENARSRKAIWDRVQKETEQRNEDDGGEGEEEETSTRERLQQLIGGKVHKTSGRRTKRQGLDVTSLN